MSAWDPGSFLKIGGTYVLRILRREVKPTGGWTEVIDDDHEYLKLDMKTEDRLDFA